MATFASLPLRGALPPDLGVQNHTSPAAATATPSFKPTFASLPLSVQTWAVQMVVFHAVGLLFELMDRLHLFPSTKVRRTRKSQYTHLLPTVLRNQILLLLPSMYACELAGLAFVGGSLHPLRFLANLPLMALGHEIVQYCGHRYLLHAPSVWLMQLLRHSVHHSTRASSAISACYMSAVDFFIEIVCPYLLPLAAVGGGGGGAAFHFLVAGAGAVGGLYEHSGYDFATLFRPAFENVGEKPLSPAEKEAAYKQIEEEERGPIRKFVTAWLADFLDNRAHLEHHTRGYVSFSDGFGSPGILDTLLRTRWDLSERRRADVEREWARQRQ
ncbi:hypothetical protein CC85DRAFT_282362 [Cutaneotrichosporon oleaginosum]|uniref:Fatty acid hydroxylase domain-containing protein n=1 Tax=Cutaneotrichosporon oleaginosum TaxID=879819 RepID=A0A0J0XXG8_9TREE|nr:uncharacterized protein CC85DRAFT_282362 [Cutaneotrichosporon oleaginosum]KLT45733.1 hypothetical protein CC85DRAFT_282362 [Cutaneotrichosporon oleaginosum]TXT04500.1 hypothetical protein COLE_07319 [Cutaneotrichosporon oleaginosum]